MRLSELKTGEKGIIVKVKGHGGFRKRIVEMGFIKGKQVTVLLNAPLHDPVKYNVMGYEISLRHSEADMIEVISEKEAHTLHDTLPAFHGSLNEEEPLNEEILKNIALDERRTIHVALVGNPNCGKTSLFNLASGSHEHVGNYSGVTVNAREGFFNFEGYHFKIVDLPGTYSLTAYSPEELYVRRHIIQEMPDVIINVVDSSNLERNLYLTTQLIDMNLRVVIALNMYDELEASGNQLDHQKLGQLLGVPMVPTICKRQKGIKELFEEVINVYENADALHQHVALRMQPVKRRFEERIKRHEERSGDPIPNHHPERVSRHMEKHRQRFKEHIEEHVSREIGPPVTRHIHINHGPELEKAIDTVKKNLAANPEIRHKYSLRYLSIKLLENDKDVEDFVHHLPNGSKILEIRNQMAQQIANSLEEDTETAITNAKYGFITGALKETFIDHHNDQRQLTKVLDSIVTHRIWGYPIFFLFLWIMFQATFSLGQYPMDAIEWLVAQLGILTERFMPEGPLKAMLIDGVLGGVGGVIVFLPNILILYFFISLMEDSGYMARAAFIMDKIMHKMGLHGKSFIPLIMGFGCNVPAIMATRMIESRSSRLITMLTVPFMSCSARLPIYLLLAGIFFPHSASLIMLTLYVIGILLSILFARFMSRFLTKKDEIPFVMELPPYRIPTAKSIFRHTWEKGQQYLRKMGGIILLASILIWFLSYYPDHNKWSTPQEQQENSYIGHIGKAIEPILQPLGMDWKLGIGLISGAGAKELVASTLCVLYANNAEADNDHMSTQLHLDGITPLVAFCFMLFVLIYFPCIATLVAIKQESGSWRWALFSGIYTTVLAWVVTFIVYRIGVLL